MIIYPIAPNNPIPKPKKKNPIVKKACGVRNGLYGEGKLMLLDKPYKTIPIRIETLAKTRT